MKTRNKFIVAAFVLLICAKVIPQFIFEIGCTFELYLPMKISVFMGANVDSREMRRTSLHYALEARNVKMVKMLLDLGADPKARWDDKFQSTPIIDSVHNNDIEISRMLLEKGADPNEKNNMGINAWSYAKRGTIIESLLREYYPRRE